VREPSANDTEARPLGHLGDIPQWDSSSFGTPAGQAEDGEPKDVD